LKTGVANTHQRAHFCIKIRCRRNSKATEKGILTREIGFFPCIGKNVPGLVGIIPVATAEAGQQYYFCL
jgi:hypothetical protein